MRSLTWALSFLSITSNYVLGTPSLLDRITELRETGFNKKLHSLVDPVGRATCNGNLSTIHYPNPTLPSAEDLLKRNAFVTRKGSKLQLLGKDYRIAGANIYWLGLDENVIPNPSYPSKRRVLEILATASAMRINTIRAHTLGVSVGNPLSVETALDVFNENAYEAIDFAILAARIYGIKLVIPLVDNYNYYHGGKYQYINFNGIPFQGTGADITPPDVGAYFYNTTAIVDSFKRYITHHLNHVNQFTGIALKDDPTILAWETGNELSGARFGDGPAPPTWTKEIVTHIKSLSKHHLVIDGSYGIDVASGMLNNEQVDIFSDHFYPPDIQKYQTGRNAVTAVDRNYFAGEYDWYNGGDPLDAFFESIQSSGVGDGHAFWSMFGHDDDCCQWVEHDDGESFYYQRDVLYIQQGNIIINASTRLNAGATSPQILPQIACPKPKTFPLSPFPPGLNLEEAKLIWDN